jgi:RHS repeat-associated protein
MSRLPHLPHLPHLLRLAALTVLCAATTVSLGSSHTTARADEPSPAPNTLAADGVKTKYGTEVTALRTRVSRTYRNSTGSYLSAISAASVNYKDSAGNWQPIDDSLTPASSGNAHVNKANRYTATLPSELGSAPVRVEFGSSWITQQLQGASATGTVDGSTETYSGALPATTVAYTVGPDQLTELLRLDSTSAPKTFAFEFKASPGTRVQKNDQGQIVLTDSSGKVSFVVPAPAMTDAAGATSGAIAVSVQPTADGATVSLTPDRTWLESSDRRFPVTVDPSVMIGNDDADCYISSGTPNTSYCGVGTNLDVGSDGSSTSRSLLYFNVGNIIPSNAIVLDANLQLYLQSSLNSTAAPLSLFKATTNWVTPPGIAQNTTWNTAQQTTPWTTPGGDMGAGPVNTAPTTVSSSGQSYNWRFTQLVQRWLDGQDPNYGVFLKGDPEGSTNVFHFSSNGDINNLPQLLVTYEYAIGDRALYTYDRQSIDDRLGLATNLGTGNLMLSANDLHISGTGLDQYLGRFYNSLGSGLTTNGSGDFDYQWQMGTGNDVFFKFYEDGSAAYYGPSGYAIPFVRKVNGDYISPTALDATLTKNADGTYTLTAHGDSVAQNFDANGRLTSIKDPNGNTIRFAYAANPSSGNGYVLSSVTDTQGRVTTFTYNSSAQLTQITDPANRLYKYAYSSTIGSLVSYTDPNNKITKFGWTNGALTSVTDPNNNVTSFTYNLNNQVTKITRGTSSWRYTYNTGNTVATDPDGHTQTYSFDGLGRVTRIVDGLGHTTFNSPSTGNLYNDDSQLLSFTNGLGGNPQFGYGTNNENRESSTLPTGAISRSTYTNTAFPYYPTSSTDPQNHTWNYSYDAHGNLLSQQEDGQAPVSFTYNTNGTIATATNGNGGVTSYGYDTHGNLTSITPPTPLGQITLTYDALSRIATVRDGKGQTTSYIYDGLDRVTKITYNDASTVTYVYDGNGNLTSQADANGTDAFTFDTQNRLTKETLPGSKTNTYTYDLAGNLATFADAGGTVTYNYDAANELSSMTDPNAKQTTFAYDNDHNRTQVNYPNGVSQYTTYDGSDRITSIVGKKPASNTVVTSLSYSYTDPGTGKDTRLRQNVTDNVADATTTYQYDIANRLASAVSPSTSYQYTYDADGNRLTATTNGVTTNATYNHADELTQSGSTSFTSDADGNLLNTSSSLALTYNPKNQTTAAGSTSFNYLGSGQTQRTAAGSTSFQNNALGLGLQVDGTGSTYFTRTPEGELISERTPAGTLYYLTDAIGSTIALTDASGAISNTYTYDPYGRITASTGTAPNPYRFVGEYFDASTQLYKIGARYYDSATGRWTSQDPVVNVLNDHGNNAYSYADDDPVNIVDPAGLTGDRGWMGPQCPNIKAVSRQWAYANCPASVYCATYSCNFKKSLTWWEGCINDALSVPSIASFTAREGIKRYVEHHALRDLGKRLGLLGLVADASVCGSTALFGE